MNHASVINFRKKYKQYKRKKLFRFYWFLFITGFIIFIISWFWSNPYFIIKNVEFSGLTRDSEGLVKNVINKYKVLNSHFFHINPLKIKYDLENYAIIEQVQIERWLFPPRIKFSIIERKPYVKIFYLSPNFTEDEPKKIDKYLFIDYKGVILPFKSNRKPAYNILFADELENYYPLNKIINLDSNKLNVIKKIIEFYEPIELNEIFYIKNLNNIILQRGNRIYWLGKIDEFEKKINIIPSLKQIEDKYKDNIKYIDLRIWQAPVIKKIK